MLAIADGSKASGALASVSYNDSWAHDHVSRQAKLAWLRGGAETGSIDGAIEVIRGALDDMRPTPFFNGELVSIKEVFAFTKSGMKSGNDAVYVQIERACLQPAITPELASRDDPTYEIGLERFYAYRPLDRRWFFNDLALLDRPGAEMQHVWGRDNVGLYALPGGTSAGPAVWCHGLLPDYHAFRGSYGGYAFPLYDRRPGHGPSNISALLVEALGSAYGTAVAAEAVFDAVLALLSATSYTTRFAEDLEDVFPHIPFPSDPAIFRDAVTVGSEIRAVETFARRPQPGFLRGRARAGTAPDGPLGVVEWIDGSITLCTNGTGRIENVPHAVWEFAVSGYRVLPRWLAARQGTTIGPSFIPDLRDLVGRIAELIDLFTTADGVLQRTLDAPLSRVAFGLDDQVLRTDGDD